MDRTRWLVMHGADPAKWAKRYSIEPGTAPCYHCDAPLTTTIPFAIGGLRGLVAPTCACGNKATPYCVVSATGGDVLGALAEGAPKSAPKRPQRGKRRKLRLVPK